MSRRERDAGSVSVQLASALYGEAGEFGGEVFERANRNLLQKVEHLNSDERNKLKQLLTEKATG